MRVALGAYLLSGTPGYRQAGIHRYIKSLLGEYASAGRHDFTALVGRTAVGEVPAGLPFRAAGLDVESAWRRIAVEQLQTPFTARSLRAELYHGMAFVLPLALRRPAVVTVHDLSFITHPTAHKRANRSYLSAFTRWSCRRASRVIAVSEWTRRDVERLLGVPAERIDVIGHGVPARFRRAGDAEIAAFRARHRIGDDSVFFLGSLEPRKNLSTLVEAFSRLGAGTLVIAGGEGWHYGAIYERVKALGLEPRVRFVGFVPDDDLPLWLSACGAFAYPSLYEGFGMPVLEAMACGAVVVASDAAALPEVVGDAGLTPPPTDPAAIAAALSRALGDGALRATLRTRGLARAAQYTWARAADLTQRCYERALGTMGA